MSYPIGMDCINLRPTPRPGHTEYSLEYSLEAPEIAAFLGPEGDPNRRRTFYNNLDFDFMWSTNEGPDPWGKGRITDMGHADYAKDGSDHRAMGICPFEDVEEVLAFDACKEYGLPDPAALVAHYEQWHQAARAALPDQVHTGGFYNSVMSGALQAFGWDMLLMAAADRERFAKVLESFARRTLHYVRAQAETSIEVFIQHDDFVWTAGPFLDPPFYRNVIIPLYRELWQALHRKGKKVLFCSDGKWDMFMHDIREAGADGFIFEPCNDFEWVADNFGETTCLVGSAVDCRTLTFGTWDQVKAEIDMTIAQIPKCRGLIWAVGNHIPSNVPPAMIVRYLDYIRKNWARL
jgi:hypothetical protein